VSTLHTDAPWLTVIVPSYCGEKWIDASLASIAAQACDGIEIFLIDSSPSRSTVELACKYSDSIHLRIFERPDLTSWQTKTNFGVQTSKSSHICWLGVDDIWLPGRADAARHWIQTAPQAALHLAPSAIIDAAGRRLGVWRCPLPVEQELRWPFVSERLLIQNFIAAPAPVFRKDAWMQCGGLDEALWYTADWDIWLKLSARGGVYYHDLVTTAFRIHGGSLTATGSRNVADFSHQMQLVLDRHLRNHDYSKKVESAARASIAVNTALAAASAGDMSALSRAAAAVLRLGISGIRQYLRDSRLFDRLLPRIRAKWSRTL
jgi:Glycosyl transferase family 2